MAFPKIMEHPDKNRIVKWLRDGKGVRWISKTLKEMYPNDKELQLSTVTLQAFRSTHLKLEGDVLADVKKAGRQKTNETALSKEHTAVRNLPTYKQKLNEIVDFHIDIKQGLTNMDALVRARLEDLFDAAQRGEITTEREKILQGYFDRYFVMIDKWAKYVDKVADIKVESNINVTVINDQMAVLRQAVHELLQEMEPEMAVRFLDRLNTKVRDLTYHPPTKKETIAEMRNEIAALPEAQIIEAEFLDEEPDDH